jgi:hypothetical protein
VAAHVVDPLVVRALVASVHLGGDHVARAPVGQQPPEADEHTGGGLDNTVLGPHPQDRTRSRANR